MRGDEPAGGQQEGSSGTKVLFFIGAGVWWFCTSQPTATALLMTGFLLISLCSVFAFLAVLLPEPGGVAGGPAFIPIPQHETNKVRALPR